MQFLMRLDVSNLHWNGDQACYLINIIVINKRISKDTRSIRWNAKLSGQPSMQKYVKMTQEKVLN